MVTLTAVSCVDSQNQHEVSVPRNVSVALPLPERGKVYVAPKGLPQRRGGPQGGGGLLKRTVQGSVQVKLVHVDGLESSEGFWC